jgi:quercetin dioxygenase-like cupin family protein
MEIKRVGSQPSAKGPSDWFTGSVRVDALFQAPEPALVAGASVTFEPGARTAWHTHPLGQILIVTAGSGWAQREGGLSSRFGREMSCCFHRVRSTGTELRLQPA